MVLYCIPLLYNSADPGFVEGRFVPSPPLPFPPLPFRPIPLSSPFPSPSLPSPFLPLPFPPFPFLSLPRPYPFPPSLPLRSRTAWLRLGGLGSATSSPIGSGRSPAAKRFLVHFQPIWAHFGKHVQLATCTISR